MAVVNVTAGELTGVDFAPSSEAAEILQNVRTIIATLKWSVPLDRGFGIDAPVDRPLPEAQAALASEIVKAVRKYEPRASVNRITWGGNGENGELVPTVQITLNE